MANVATSAATSAVRVSRLVTKAVLARVRPPPLRVLTPARLLTEVVGGAQEQAEGAGATVRRSIGTPQLRNFTPFLMLDK